MIEEPDKKLMSDGEWADLMEAEYTAQGSPKDTLAGARVWQRLEAQITSGKRTKKQNRSVAWAAWAAGIVAMIGVTHFFQNKESWREKGRGISIPIFLTPYVLEQDGGTIPAETKIKAGTTVVFRVRAVQNGVYALIVSEGSNPLRVAINEDKIGIDDDLVTKEGGAVFGIKVESPFKACVIAEKSKDDLAERLKDLNELFKNLPIESCASFEIYLP